MSIHISCCNDGPSIKATNYWESELSHDGLCFLSWNAGAARLLVPESLEESLKEMRGASHVIVSRGQLHGRRDCLELLFEDNSDSPFCILLAAEQSDRLLPRTEHAKSFDFTVWTRDGLALRFPAKYRIVAKLPCLKPWAHSPSLSNR